MQTKHRPRIASLIALAALVGTAAVQRATPDGAIALEDCWHTRGGSLSRSGAAATKAVRGAVKARRSRSFEGEIEGKAVVWRDRVITSERRDAEACYLHRRQQE